jgi:hypothetical protein
LTKLTDDDLKPKNRKPNDLSHGSKELQHAGGSIVNKWPAWLSVLIMKQEAITGLKTIPGVTSIISGGPAIIYRSGGAGIEIPLTPDEALRYIGNSLTPDEFFKIVAAYGGHEELGETFYNTTTGRAVDPTLTRIAFAKAGNM